jgi:hypothetical protein
VLHALWSQEPNWVVTAVVGGVLGAGAARLGLLPWQFLRHRLTAHPLLGLWHEAHWTFLHGRQVLGRGEIRLTRGVRTPVRVHVVSRPVGATSTDTLSYRGEIRAEKGHHVLVLTGSHDETLIMRLLAHLPTHDAVLPGVWMSQDHDSRPASGVLVLSRTELPDEEARDHLRKASHTGRGVLRLR